MTIVKWIHCLVALNEHNEVVGTLYDTKVTIPFPTPKTPVQPSQTLKTMPRVEQARVPPTREQVKKAYGG